MPDFVTLSTDAELADAVAVHHAVHGDPVPIWEEFLHRHPRWSAPGAHRAVIEAGRIVALTSVALWDHRFGDTTLPAAEIGLVGTLPDHRGRGHSRALMESWLATMRVRRIPISFLTGIPGFYERWAHHYATPDHANHYLAIDRAALAAVAGDAELRPADPERDIPALVALLAAEMRHTPASPVLDPTLVRYFLDRAGHHGVDWLVADGPEGTLTGVVRLKRWHGATGPQRPGAVTIAAASSEPARRAIAATMLRHLDAAGESQLPLAIAPHGPFATWLHHRGAWRRSDRATSPGAYASMVRIDDLPAVLNAVRSHWRDPAPAAAPRGTALTLRVGPDATQIATLEATADGITVHPGAGGIEIGAPPAVTVPWVTGWRPADDWLDGTPLPPLPGPAYDPGDPAAVPPGARKLLRALFPLRHPYIGDTIQGA